MRPLWRIYFHTWLNHHLGIGTRTSVVVFHSREGFTSNSGSPQMTEPCTQRRWDVSLTKWFQMTSSSTHLGALVRLGHRFIFILKCQVLIIPLVRFQSLIYCTWNENKPCSWLVLKKQTFVTYVIVFVICDVGLGFSSFRPWSMICLHLIFLWVFPISGLGQIVGDFRWPLSIDGKLIPVISFDHFPSIVGMFF